MSSNKKKFEGDEDEEIQYKRKQIQDYIAVAPLSDAQQILTTAKQNLIHAKLIAAKEKNKKEECGDLINQIRVELLLITKSINERAMSPTQAMPITQEQAMCLLTTPTQVSAPIKKMTQEERERSITLHLRLLLHTVACKSCDSKNCKKMKDLLSHGDTCVINECILCCRIKILLKTHSNLCNFDKCRVKYCRNYALH